MTLRFLIASYFLSLLPAAAQQGKEIIDTKNINYSLLTALFIKQLNQHRADVKRKVLTHDDFLEKAALDQAVYMSSTKKITHDQNVKGKEKPTARVRFYNGNNGNIGENCLAIPIGVPSKMNYRKDTVVVRTYEEVANALFLTWKYSAGHYKNMIDSTYEASGVGYAFDSQSKRLYATQVFGSTAYKLPKEFPDTANTYGILESDPNHCKYSADMDWSTWKLSNYIDVLEKSAFLNYRRLDLMQRVFAFSNDAIALDVVKREQFTCGTHQLHGSGIFDGMMLPPVYSPDLFKANLNVKYKELFSKIGTVPDFYDPSKYQLNAILIKGKRMCRYSFPVHVVAKNLNLLDLYPIFETTEGLAAHDSFDLVIDHYVPFERGVTDVEDRELTRLLKKLNVYKSYIQNISIRTFSSIEGSTENNIKLQEARAKAIRSKIIYYVNKNIDWKVESKENWDEFYKQIEGTGFRYLKNYSQSVIKEKLKDEGFLDSLDFLLDKQREAIIKIHVKGTYQDILSPEISLIAFKRALQNENAQQAWIIQSQMIYHLKKKSLFLNEMADYDVPQRKEFLPVLANMAGIKGYNTSELLLPKHVEYIKQIYQLDSTRFTLRYNYCVYVLKRWATLGDTVENTVSMEKRIMALYGDISLNESIHKLLLNYYVLAADHNYWNKNYDRLNYCLQRIYDLYPSANVTEKEAVDLAKLFNLYYKFDWSIALMHPFTKKERPGEELLFTFIRTGALDRENISDAEYYGLVDKAIGINRGRFCRWIDKVDFQLLRLPEFQKRFCSNCTE